MSYRDILDAETLQPKWPPAWAASLKNLPFPPVFSQPTGFQEMVDIGTWGIPEQSPTSQGDQM